VQHGIGGGAGFGLDPTDPRRVYLCKASCDAYRNVLRDASRYAALTFQSAIAVPVFAHKPGCQPKGDGTGTGATPKP
jgi:hypothetical protein